MTSLQLHGRTSFKKFFEEGFTKGHTQKRKESELKRELDDVSEICGSDISEISGVSVESFWGQGFTKGHVPKRKVDDKTSMPTFD